jgi:hypothetical protein
MPNRRDLIFLGYSGTPGNNGVTEPDLSHLMVALTLREHILRRYPGDQVEIICAWHKNTFVKSLMTPSSTYPDLKIRQLHYVGHGYGGGLYLGYHNKIAVDARSALASVLQRWPVSTLSGPTKRAFVLWNDAGLMSGFFDILDSSRLAAIKAQLAPEALMHVWGCFAGAPDHTFDRTDPYWDLLNALGAPVPGIARHIARALGIQVTAVRDPAGVHGMNFWYRDQHGTFHTSRRPQRIPQWLWPTGSASWITYDPSGTGNQRQINFLGGPVAASRLQPGKPPAWLLAEIPVSVAKRRPSAPPACSVVPVAI